MKIHRKRNFDVPCGKTLGHGESCVEGYSCTSCDYILKVEAELKFYKDIIDTLGQAYIAKDIGLAESALEEIEILARANV